MRFRSVLFWLPRVLALAAAVFPSLFALDVFDGQQSAGATLLALAIHLVPTLAVIAALVVAWRHEVLGGLLFIALGIGYVMGIDAADHLDWVAIVAGPLWLVGTLFLVAHAVGRGSTSASQRA